MSSTMAQPKPIVLYAVIMVLLGYIVLDEVVEYTREIKDSPSPCPACPKAPKPPVVPSKDVAASKTQKMLENEKRPPKSEEVRDEPPATTLEQTNPVSSKPSEVNKQTVVAQNEVGGVPQRDVCNVYDLSQPNNFDFKCITMKFTPSAPVCIYPVEQDIYVSKYLADLGVWEGNMVVQYQTWLSSYGDQIGVLDVGTNLGVYSLVAAAMGHQVLSVEPNIENIRHYHKAIKLGHFEERVTLLQNAVSDKHGIAKIFYSSNNQGDTQMQAEEKNANASQINDERLYTKFIVLDDLVSFCKFRQAIMKIDCQTYEHRAMVQASLLFEKIDIVKVLMEWEMMKTLYRKKQSDPEEFQLVENMLKFFSDRKYTPKDWDGKVLDTNAWDKWPIDIVWHKESTFVTPQCGMCKVYDLSQPNNFDFKCITMKFTPSAPVCIYPVEQDIYVSKYLADLGVWEGNMVVQYQTWLSSYGDQIGVLDVGTNLGVYSLVAAAMGHQVLSVEPNIENIRHYHKAIKLGHFEERVTLLQNAVSDKHGIAKIFYSSNNQGDTQMQAEEKNANASQINDERLYTKFIVLDDLVGFCKFRQAIMKIDCQTYEHRAMVQASLLFEKIDIVKVLMEWEMMKTLYRKKASEPEEFQLVENMLKFFSDRKYTPKDWDGKVLDTNAWDKWPIDIVWHKESNL